MHLYLSANADQFVSASVSINNDLVKSFNKKIMHIIQNIDKPQQILGTCLLTSI